MNHKFSSQRDTFGSSRHLHKLIMPLSRAAKPTKSVQEYIDFFKGKGRPVPKPGCGDRIIYSRTAHPTETNVILVFANWDDAGGCRQFEAWVLRNQGDLNAMTRWKPYSSKRGSGCAALFIPVDDLPLVPWAYQYRDGERQSEYLSMPKDEHRKIAKPYFSIGNYLTLPDTDLDCPEIITGPLVEDLSELRLTSASRTGNRYRYHYRPIPDLTSN